MPAPAVSLQNDVAETGKWKVKDQNEGAFHCGATEEPASGHHRLIGKQVHSSGPVRLYHVKGMEDREFA